MHILRGSDNEELFLLQRETHYEESANKNHEYENCCKF